MKKTRFVVLTHAQLSWFKRNPGDTEYGDERGAIPLDQVTSVKLDGEKIEVFDQGGLRRWFLCRDGKAKAWRDAIDVARQARCRSPAASSPREAPSALIIRTRQYAKAIVETRAAYGAATREAARNGCLRHKRGLDGAATRPREPAAPSTRRVASRASDRWRRGGRHRRRERKTTQNQRRRGLRGPAKKWRRQDRRFIVSQGRGRR